jgi:hypothetical protein
LAIFFCAKRKITLYFIVGFANRKFYEEVCEIELCTFNGVDMKEKLTPRCTKSKLGC